MSRTTNPNSRWTALTMLVGGCALVVSAGAGIVKDVHPVPQAKGYHTNVVRVHAWQPHNHTQVSTHTWHLSNIQKLHLFG